MAKGVYIGEANLTHKIKKMYLGAESTAHKVKKGYIGVDGVAKLFFSGATVWKKYNAIATVIYSWNQYEISYKAVRTAERNGHHTVYKTYSLSPGRSQYYIVAGSGYNIHDGKFYTSGGTVYTDQGYMGGSTVASTDNFERNYKYAYGSATGGNSGTNVLYEIDDDSHWGWGLMGHASPDEETEYWVEWSISGTTGYYTLSKSTGTLLGSVTSTSSNAYPSNGISGNYWYKSTGNTTEYSQGSYISDVEADPGTYPENGRHTDGYWYVKQPE